MIKVGPLQTRKLLHCTSLVPERLGMRWLWLATNPIWLRIQLSPDGRWLGNDAKVARLCCPPGARGGVRDRSFPCLARSLPRPRPRSICNRKNWTDTITYTMILFKEFEIFFFNNFKEMSLCRLLCRSNFCGYICSSGGVWGGTGQGTGDPDLEPLPEHRPSSKDFHCNAFLP